MILHTVSTSPFTQQNLIQCLKRKAPSDKLLLIQDAVYAMKKADLTQSLLEHGPIYILKEDAQARGVNIESDLYQVISYSDFVALSLECNQVISW